jgi:hypothetical protein
LGDAKLVHQTKPEGSNSVSVFMNVISVFGEAMSNGLRCLRWLKLSGGWEITPP